jgi:hypothetical protein
MTHPLPLRSPRLLARSALLALVLAGCAGTAASQDRTTAAAPPRIAVLAGPDARAAELASATDGAADVRRVGGALEAQATATALAGEGYSTVIAVGAQARAAVAQAQAGEVGDGVRWESGR